MGLELFSSSHRMGALAQGVGLVRRGKKSRERAVGDGPRFVEDEWQTPGGYTDASWGWKDRVHRKG